MTRTASRSWRWRLPLALLLPLGALLGLLGLTDASLLDLLPVALLTAAMALRPYPGAELIVRLGRRRQRRRRPLLAPPRRRPPRRAGRASCPISLALGGRAPPAVGRA